MVVISETGTVVQWKANVWPHKLFTVADVSNNKDNETKFYYDLTETSFKKRYGNHKRSFIHEQHKNDTELSKYIWDLTSSHKVPTIKWCIVRKIHGNAKSDFCKLCLTEKYFILNNLGDNKLLNKKSEFVNKCRHQKKLLLKFMNHGI